MARKVIQPIFPDGCELVSLKISNGALASAQLPNRIKLLNWGSNESVKGPVILDAASVKELAANQQKLGHDRVALDYEHNTVPGSAEYERSEEPRKVAAYGTPELIDGDGLYLRDLEWTPSGQADAKNFSDLSPAVARDSSGRVTFVHSAALTRNGAVHGLTFFNNQPKIEPMDGTLTIAEIAKALGLADTASKEDVITKLQSLSKPSEQPPVTEMKAVVDGKTIVLSSVDIAGALDRLKTLEAGVKETAEAAAKAEKTGLITKFAAEGKAPLGEDGQPMNIEALEKLSACQLKLLLANTPVTVPLSARGARANETEKASDLKGLAKVQAAFKAEREAKLRVA